MATVKGLGIQNTDIIVPGSSPEITAYYTAHHEADQEGVITDALAQAYLGLFGVEFPADLIGKQYSTLKGSIFDGSRVLRGTPVDPKA